MSGGPLSVRDYKHPPRTGLGLSVSPLRAIAACVALAIALAAGFSIAHHRKLAVTGELGSPKSVVHGDAASAAAHSASLDSAAADSAASAGKYDFYQMLPKSEVLVPERAHASRVAPLAQVERPGSYFLQIGSYRDAAVAERIRAQIASLGIDATVQRFAVDTNVWHRVRVGPVRDLAQLNRLRRQLQASNLDSVVIKAQE